MEISLLINHRLLLVVRRGRFAKKSPYFSVFNPQSFRKWENVSIRNFAKQSLQFAVLNPRSFLK